MFEIGRKAYFVENVNKAIYGTITGLKKYGLHNYLVTLTTKQANNSLATNRNFLSASRRSSITGINKADVLNRRREPPPD